MKLYYIVRHFLIYKVFRQTNTKLCRRFVKKYLNTIVYTLYDKLEILEGFNIGDDDLYYLTRDIDGELHYQTCVGYCIPLKGKISRDAYRYLKSTFDFASERRYEANFQMIRKENIKQIEKIEKKESSTISLSQEFEYDSESLTLKRK